MNSGIHKMSMAQYQADPCASPSLSSGIAHRLLTQSALHAWFHHPRLNPEYVAEEDDKFDLGATAHALLLEGEESIAVIDAPDWRKTAAKTERDVMRAAGRIPVLAHKMAECRAMAKVAKATLLDCPDAKIDLMTGFAEHVLIWQDSKVWCRARPDWMSADRKIMLNYKTTSGIAEPSAWSRNQMVPLGFDLEAAHYLRGNALLGVALCSYLFLVQENYPPYACSFVSPDLAMLDIAERKRDFATQLWSACLANKCWPSYPNRIAYVEPAAWQINEVEEWSDELKRRIELGAQG